MEELGPALGLLGNHRPSLPRSFCTEAETPVLSEFPGLLETLFSQVPKLIYPLPYPPPSFNLELSPQRPSIQST